LRQVEDQNDKQENAMKQLPIDIRHVLEWLSSHENLYGEENFEQLIQHMPSLYLNFLSNHC